MSEEKKLEKKEKQGGESEQPVVKKTVKKAGRYFVCGMTNTLIAYVIYEGLALTMFRGEWLPVASLISGATGIFTGYFLHSRFTWKGRKIGKFTVVNFLVWNIFMGVAVKPVLTKLFQLGIFDGLYLLAFNICQFLHIPFSMEFVETTGNFVLTTAIIMVINYLVYDRLVFGKKKSSQDD